MWDESDAEMVATWQRDVEKLMAESQEILSAIRSMKNRPRALRGLYEELASTAEVIHVKANYAAGALPG